MLKRSLALFIVFALIMTLVPASVIAQEPEEEGPIVDSTLEDLGGSVEEETVEDSVADDLATEEDVADEGAVEDSVADELAPEEDVADEGAVEDSTVEDLAEDLGADSEAGDLATEEDVADEGEVVDSSVATEEVIEDLAVDEVAASSDVSTSALPGDGWWTSITLQNPGSSDATFSMTAKDEVRNGSNSYDATGCSLGNGSSTIHNPGKTPDGSSRIGFSSDCGASGSDSMPSGFEGGVTVQSDQSLSVVVGVGNNTNGDLGAGGTASAFYQGVDSTKTDTTLYFPVVKNDFYGQTTTFYVQAVEEASVTMTYSDGNSDGPHTIPAGQTRLFSPTDAGVASDASYAATATSSSGAIAGAVIEHPHSASPASFALGTRAFTSGEADTTLYIPAVKNEYYGGTTGLAVQAVGGDVSVIVEFSITGDATSDSSCAAGSSSAVSITSGSSVIFGGGGDFNLPSGFGNGCFGAAIVKVQDGSAGKVIATVNETSNSGKAVYSGFSASAATQTIAVPQVKEAFYGGKTSVVVQAVGESTETTSIKATYTNSSDCASGCEVAPNGGNAGSSSTAGGSSVNFRLLNSKSTEYSGTLPAEGTSNAVVISSDTLPVVAIAQETGNLDVKNYEGFNQ